MQFPRPVILLLAMACACLSAPAIAAPPLPAFTAHYRVLRNGSPIGTATLTLARGNSDNWIFTTNSEGTSGLASLLGASISETSKFRWVDGLPQGISYDYVMSTALKKKERHVRFDWSSHTIEVDDHGKSQYPTQPGAVERHTVVLALGAGLAAGRDQFTLSVAVRDRIEPQHYEAQRGRTVTVPAGNFQAIRVRRTDGGDPFTAWFAPDKLPAPIKVDQTGKDGFSLELESWSEP